MADTRLLFLGDIVGKPGREAIKKMLPELLAKYRPDFVIANCENIAHGAGIKREKLEEMMAVGIHGFTAGDHTFDVKGVEDVLNDPVFPIVRPGNWPGEIPGRGWRVIEHKNKRLLLMNTFGRVFLKIGTNDPFACVEQMLKEARNENYDVSLLDVHAEETSEKRAIAEEFDGRIDVILGTHTHVQTADAQTLKKGTGFLTDAGMCGPEDSVLGSDVSVVLERLKKQIQVPMRVASGPALVCGCMATITKEGTEMEAMQCRNIDV